MSLGTFSVGIDYDYYDKESELYVKPKYDNLKTEVVNYKHINMKQYQQEIIPKVDAYFDTILVKAIKSVGPYNKYGIKHGEVINKSRLMCIILYTDYTELSKDFSCSFRKSNTFEPTQAMITRHTNYYWMSKLLRETIRVYGESYYPYRTFLGPFYCGMSLVLNMTSFAISLLSPTSTSCHIEVSIKFSGEGGSIIQFDNTRGKGMYVKGVDVSWISRYREEDERYT